MVTKKTSWDDIPSLQDLSIDWEYEPENTLGRRSWPRIGKTDLHSFFSVVSTPVKIVTRNVDITGQLIDISIKGLAVLLDTQLTDMQLIKVNFFLGKQKVISRAIIRNVCCLTGKYRIGMEFEGLGKEGASFIAGLVSSKVYRI